MKKIITSRITLTLTGIMIFFACQSPSSTKSKYLTGLSWLEEMTLSEMQQGYREGKFTVTEVITPILRG